MISAKKARAIITTLEDSMARNPVADLVEAGLFQTLVEDIAAEEDQYSYKSRLTREVNARTGAESNNPLVKGARATTKFMVMAHDTTLYKMLNKATIYSDFTSRVVLHKYNTTKQDSPMSKQESLSYVRQAFVNYDVPTHKGLQYLNDTGLLWFTKYYLRIQVVIAQLLRDNPARALALMGLDEVVDVSTIFDSFFANSSPVKTGAGAAELINVLDEPVTIQGAAALLSLGR